MRTLIVIPARYASKRFPGKPLHPIAGVSMLARTIDAANRAAALTGAKVLVATDDERIAAHAREVGAAALVDPGADFVVNLQGDAPFTPPDHLAAVIAAADRADVVTPVVRLTWAALDELRERKRATPFSGTTCVRLADGRAAWFSKTILPAIRDEAKLRAAGGLSPVLQHIGLYGYARAALERIAALPESPHERLEGLEQLRFLENGLSVHAVLVEPSALHSAGIDTPEDAAHAERLLALHGDPMAGRAAEG
jgi:3-deoxy-manno-octulosonate cytidylyltransferase (CMP-KDO synthetase)